MTAVAADHIGAVPACVAGLATLQTDGLWAMPSSVPLFAAVKAALGAVQIVVALLPAGATRVLRTVHILMGLVPTDAACKG